MAFLPWLHYRFIPVTAGLLLYYLYQEYHHRTKHRYVDLAIVFSQLIIAAGSLMAFFYQRYGQITPNTSDHAGSNDLAGTARGAAGLFLDQQWGLFIAAPIFILTLVGVILMLRQRGTRKDLLWLGIVFVPYFGVIANYAQWWGEWCPPARYMASTLPLLALPFAVALDRIQSRAYLGIYAALMLLSLGMTWGFLHQPQWMYHQPDGRNQIFLYGVPQLLSNTLFDRQAQVVSTSLISMTPSFVAPYFEYVSKGTVRGGEASAKAWTTSLWPFSAILAIIVSSLFLSLRKGIGRTDITPRTGSEPDIVELSSRQHGYTEER